MFLGNQGLPENNGKIPFWRDTTPVLLSILLLAAFLRMVNPGQSPPGLNQDEAANAWNAYCLLKTGKDQAGVSWPIFYMHCLGANRTPLGIYVLLPFQAIGGLNIFTTRLPAAGAGIITIVLIYFVGSQLFDRKTGLVAAVLLAVNPWHLQLCRWGHEANLSPLLALIPLSMLVWANFPISNRTNTPRLVPAILAGAATGICCYGYPSVQIFIPVFLLAIVLSVLTAWWCCLKTRTCARAIGAFIIAFGITFGPLAWQHIFHPEGISRHARFQRSLLASESLPGALKNVAARYIQHFGLDFLFITGDKHPLLSPPGIGQFHWYMLPLMVLGLIFITRRFRSPSARILLAYVLVYPVGDSLFLGPGVHALGVHALRSSPGLCGLVLLAAVGAKHTAKWLFKRDHTIAFILIIAFAVSVIGFNTRYLNRFYGRYNDQTEIRRFFHRDLVEACRWLRPNLDDFDAVFCTTKGFNMPYVISLVILRHDPDRWFSEPRDFTTPGEWDFYTRYGKMYFMYGYNLGHPVRQAITELKRNNKPDKIAFIVRPGELGLKNPVHQIHGPDGRVTLWVCSVIY